jgi:hypothetical protein
MDIERSRVSSGAASRLRTSKIGAPVSRVIVRRIVGHGRFEGIEALMALIRLRGRSCANPLESLAWNGSRADGESIDDLLPLNWAKAHGKQVATRLEKVALNSEPAGWGN